MSATKRKIFVACRALGIDNDTRQSLQLRVVGKSSLSEMTEEELRKVVKALEQKGFKPSRTGGTAKAAKRADVRYIHVLWGLLKRADALENPTRDGLNAFIRKRFAKTWGAALIDVDAMEDHGQISDVINALKSWCDRAGVDYSGGA